MNQGQYKGTLISGLMDAAERARHESSAKPNVIGFPRQPPLTVRPGIRRSWDEVYSMLTIWAGFVIAGGVILCVLLRLLIAALRAFGVAMQNPFPF